MIPAEVLDLLEDVDHGEVGEELENERHVYLDFELVAR
jgi:hypothetical protein